MYTKCPMCGTGDVYEHICNHCDNPCDGFGKGGVICQGCAKAVLYAEHGIAGLDKDKYDELGTLWVYVALWGHQSSREAELGASWYTKPRH